MHEEELLYGFSSCSLSTQIISQKTCWRIKNNILKLFLPERSFMHVILLLEILCGITLRASKSEFETHRIWERTFETIINFYGNSFEGN